MRVTVEGELPAVCTAKDLILALIGQIGTGGGTGHVIEYTGPAISALSMEGRMTVSNMSIEAGARAGLIAPDEKTFAYLEGRPYAPKGADWDASPVLPSAACCWAALGACLRSRAAAALALSLGQPPVVRMRSTLNLPCVRVVGLLSL